MSANFSSFFSGAVNFYLYQISAEDVGGSRWMKRVGAAGGDDLSLGLGVGGEDFEYGDEMLIAEILGFAAQHAADVAAGDSGLAGNVGMGNAAFVADALQGGSEKAHLEVEGFWLSVECRSAATFFCIAMRSLCACDAIATLGLTTICAQTEATSRKSQKIRVNIFSKLFSCAKSVAPFAYLRVFSRIFARGFQQQKRKFKTCAITGSFAKTVAR